MARLGIAICIPDDKKVTSLVARSGRLPLYGFPHKLTIPNGRVALVCVGGRVVLTARAIRVTGPTAVRLVTGKYSNRGYIVTLRNPQRPKGEMRIGIRWRAIGQFRYLKRWSPTIVGPITPGDGEYLEVNKNPDLPTLPRRYFFGGIPGIPRNAPEAKLVREYVSWLRADSDFEHDYLHSEHRWTDLFDRRFWRLIEAKVESDRRTMRLALGQLLDYKRFYTRKPSLGVLLGAKPAPACITFLQRYGVTAVWRTPSGRFLDSSPGHGWTFRRRNLG